MITTASSPRNNQGTGRIRFQDCGLIIAWFDQLYPILRKKCLSLNILENESINLSKNDQSNLK